MESNKILERIESYSKGKMSLEEKFAFEIELTLDKTLNDQFEYSQIVDQMVIAGEVLNLKQQMSKDLSQPKSKMWSYLGASLLVVSAFTGIFLIFNKKEDKPEVLNKVKVSPIVVDKVEIVESKKVESQKVEVKNPVSELPVKSVAKKSTTINNANQSISEGNVSLVQPFSPAQVPTSGAVQTTNQPKRLNEVANQVIPKIDLCSSLIGYVEFQTVASCKGQETGEVFIKTGSVKGGQAPFTFTIGEKTSLGIFSNLAAGQYSLLIKDGNGCSVENLKKIVVEEKKCISKKEYIFNPEFDTSWPIPYDIEKKAVNLTILEKGGKVFFQSAVSAFQPSEWKGESNAGLTLGMGIYFFTIEYADGSVDEGSIVVSR